MGDDVSIRLARPDDAGTIAEFNIAMALETENKKLEPETIAAGVKALFDTPQFGFYVVAEGGGEIVASLMITPEWSDWRNGVFWWIQSVYVKPSCRRRGVYRSLYEYVKTMAAGDGNVCGFRLYVERNNAPARKAYETLGMEETYYTMYEEPLSS